MYVLHHADQPSIYAGLPDQAADQCVRRCFGKAWSSHWLWQVLPPRQLAGFLHWITVGPNEVQSEDEAEARRDAFRGMNRDDIPQREPLIRYTTAQPDQPLDHRRCCFVLLVLSGLVDVSSHAVLPFRNCSGAGNGRARLIPGSGWC